MPPMPKVGPEIKFEGHPSFMPNIIPILPEPLVTVEVAKGGTSAAPKVTTDITQKKVTLDLSQVRKYAAVAVLTVSYEPVVTVSYHACHACSDCCL